MLRYSKLTDRQKDIITNGCGGKGMGFKPPQFFFKASCNHHDFYYWRGGTEADRKHADSMFFLAMREDADRGNNIFAVTGNKLAAIFYYLAVRIGGRKYFSFGEMKTEKDLPA